MLRLPVSGVAVQLLEPAGTADLMLCEAVELDTKLAVALAGCIATTPTGQEIAWAEMPVVDLDAVLLLFRQVHVGDVVRAEAVCPLASCGKPVDVSFRISEYLAYHRPSKPAGIKDAGEGWYRLTKGTAEFRLPQVSDVEACASDSDPAAALVARCIRPAGLSPRDWRQADRAMSAMAPSLCEDLGATCVECKSEIRLRFDPQDYVLREFRDRALGIREDVHTLASTYHWREADILALPRSRRIAYVQMVHGAQSA